MLTRFFKKSLILSGLMLLSQSKASAQVGVSDNYFQSKYPTFAVLGDSYSSYNGKIPAGSYAYYPQFDVQSPYQQWWGRLEFENGIKMVINCSSSGSTVTYAGWDNNPFQNPDRTGSFIGRSAQLQEASLLIIEGATNDALRKNQAGLGEYKYDNFTEDDKVRYRSGLAYLISTLQQRFPNTQLVFMLNSGIDGDYQESTRVVCQHYNVPVYELTNDIPKKDNSGAHPVAEGMRIIDHQLQAFMAQRDGFSVLDELIPFTSNQTVLQAKTYLHLSLKGKQWQPLCLPFDADQALVDRLFGTGTKIAAYTSVNGNTIKFGLTDKITAHVPVLVYPGKSVNKPLYLTNLPVVQGSAQAVGAGNVKLQGIYKAETIGANNKNKQLINLGGKAYVTAEEVKVGGFSGYLTSANGQDVTLEIESTTYGIEAENATLNNAPTVTNDAFCSGGKYVGFIAGNKTLSFNYNAPKAGNYTLGIDYMTYVNRDVVVTVNGNAQTVTCTATGTWEGISHDVKTATVALNAGQNTIVLSNPNGDAPNIDKITLNLENEPLAANIADATAPVITPYVNDNSGWKQQNTLAIAVNGSFTFGPQADQDGTWTWTGPNGFTSNNREINANNVTSAQAGAYVATFTSVNGKQTTETFNLIVNGGIAPANGAKTKVVCVGNSITEGYTLTNGQKAWPAQLGDLLGGNYNVINRGRSGLCMLKNAKNSNGSSRSYWNSDGYRQAKEDRPDVVIIALGTNDAGQEVWTNANEFRNDYIDMINEFKAINNKVKVYVCYPPYIYNDWQNQNLENNVLPAIQQTAFATGATVINLHDVTANHRNDLYNDALHPNVDGAALIARTIYGTVIQTGAVITPYGYDKYGWRQLNNLYITAGDTFSLGPQADQDGTWTWTGPNGFTSDNREFTINNTTAQQAGEYVATFTNGNGQKTSVVFNVNVLATEAPALTPYMLEAGKNWVSATELTVTPGAQFHIGPQESHGYDNGNGSWNWAGPNNFTSHNREFNIPNSTEAQSGIYTVDFFDQWGRRVVENFTVYVGEQPQAAEPETPEVVEPVTPSTGASEIEEARVAYRIVGNGGKSLFVTDASLDNNANVVEWEETDVAAQQWYLVENGNNTYKIVNVYSGQFLTNNGGLKQTTNANDNNSVWTLQDQGNNVYKMTANGQTFTYTFEKVRAQSEFNAELRDRTMSGFLAHYLQYKGGDFMTIVNGGWSESESLEVLLDAYETSGNPQYLSVFKQCYAYFKDHVGDRWDGGTVKGGYNWYGYDFNDDVMWQIILAARAFKLTGEKVYLDDARRNFDIIWDRAYLGYVGLLRWAENSGDRQGANSCVNGPAEVAACYIAEGYASLGDNNTANTYWNKAKELYGNQRIYLADVNSGQVYDGVNFNEGTTNVRSRSTWASTYNQGTMLGAAVLLHKHFGDNFYKTDAQNIYKYTANNMTDGHRIIKQCEGLGNRDLQGFKGILMRYIRNYYEHFNDADAADLLSRNAFHAYNNRNSQGFGITNWRRKAPEDLQYDGVNYGTSDYAFSAVTVVSAAFNAPIITTSGTSLSFEAEDMTLTGNAEIRNDERASNGSFVGGLDNGNGYATFTYNAPAAGRYILDFYYMTAQNRDLQVSTGSQTVTTTFQSNGSWDGTNISVQRVMLDLNAGQNTIRLGNDAGTAPNFDKVVVSAPASAGSSVQTIKDGGILEAEDADISGNIHIVYDAAASGRVTVGYIGGAAGNDNTLTFHYNAAQAGEYEIEVHYFTGANRDMYTQVNGGAKNVETYASTGGWVATATGVKILTASLNAGDNTIKVGNDNGDAPNLDYIVVRRVGTDIDSNDDPVTGIEEKTVENRTDNRLFDLFGQPVSTLRKGGIYIRNGRKFIAR